MSSQPKPPSASDTFKYTNTPQGHGITYNYLLGLTIEKILTDQSKDRPAIVLNKQAHKQIN